MSTRNVQYRFHPKGGTPPSLSGLSSLTIDMREVAMAGVKELLQTRISSLPVGLFLEEMLVPAARGTDLIWRGAGIGVSVEVRRGFSGLLGRFFSRWYLQKYHGMQYFQSIDTSPMPISARLVITRDGETYLPDWVCAGGGVVGLAESKGSSARLYSHAPMSASPLRKAKAQIENAKVWIRKPDHSFGLRQFKGWAIMSRWATEENGFDPVLYVLDPKTAGDPMEPDEIDLVRIELAKAHFADFMRTFGFDTIAEKLSPPLDEVKLALLADMLEVPFETMIETRAAQADRPSRPPELVELRREKSEGIKFLGVVVDRAGRVVPEPVLSLLERREYFSQDQRDSFSFVGFDFSAIDDLLERRQTRSFQREVSVRQDPRYELPDFAQDEDGFVIASFDILDRAGKK